MRKKIMFIVLICIIIVLVIYFFLTTGNKSNDIENSSEINHSELGKIRLPTVESPLFPKEAEKKPKNTEKKAIKKSFEAMHEIENNEQNPIDNDDIPDSLMKDVLKDIEENSALNHQAMLDSGFSEEAAQNIASGNPKNLLSIDSMPKELQSSIRKELEKSKKNGYDDVDEKDADEITGVTNYILGTSVSVPNINFSLSIIPQLISANYNYIGYTFPNTYDSQSANGVHETVRRVFQRLDSSHILIVEETSLNSGSSNLISEFVNSQVASLPAIYAIKKSPTNKTYAMLNWTTDKFAYSLYQVPPLDNSKNILLSVGSSLTEINKVNNERTENERSVPIQEENEDAPF